ncbi:MAG: flagellin lysine-N-methylase, partial [Cellulomonas sp.]|nr:flagellin lysine-N-methylase [Cellulomonas sp.]
MTDHHAAGHMTRFQCLGGACEDTCCIAWEVPVSPPDQARLRGALGTARADQLVTQVPDGRGGMLTVLRKLPDGACPELDGDHLCRLHARHGEPALPDTCATYPRMIRRLDDRLELTGLMSCPEVARLVLLADDGALVPTGAAVFGRATPQSRLGRAGAPPYFAMFATVRDAPPDLCAARSTAYSSASPLYFAAELVARISPFFHRGATVAEPERLASELAEIRQPDVQAALAAK